MPYSLSLLSSYHYFDNTSKEASFCPSSVYVIMVCLSPSFALFLSLSLPLSLQFLFMGFCCIHWFREFRSLHGWKPSTRKNFLRVAPIMKQQRRTRKIFAAWIAAQVFAPIVCHRIASIGFFKFVVMYIMMSSGSKIFRSSQTALMFR